ncbi:damage-inducible protein [Acetobacteraceae bacterium H6797]|nr:damage-inducible protein [Acetobacteraceae bacterium H6797]
MPATASILGDLRAQLARIERGASDESLTTLSLCEAIDQHLPGGGLAHGAVHEIQAVDAGAGLAMAALILSRTSGAVIWIAPEPDPVFPAGLHAFGLDATRLLIVQYRKPEDGLWAMEEALRCQAIGGSLLRLDRIEMTASRRLQLAAEAGGGLGLLLRKADAGEGPSNATTRWRATSLPHPAVRPAWRLDLLRCRGGQPASWEVDLTETGLQVTAPLLQARRQ